MWDKKRELKDRYNSTSQFYDSRYQEIQEQKFQAVLKEIEDFDRLIDLGCGTGMFLERLAPNNELTLGVDFSIDMLNRAKERLAEFSKLVLADIDNLPFRENSFDLVVSITLLQNMPHPERTISEIARITEDMGKTIVTVLEKKHSTTEIRNWMSSAGFEPLKVEKIPDSEDFLYVGRLEEGNSSKIENF